MYTYTSLLSHRYLFYFAQVAHFFPRDASSGKQPISVNLDTFFAFHHANAFEDPETGEVTFDTVQVHSIQSINASPFLNRYSFYK